MLSKSIGQWAKADTGKEVDSIARVSRHITGKHAGIPLAVLRVGRLETISQFRHSHCLGHFLNQNLYKDSRGRCCLIFIQVNDRQDRPGHGICMKKVRKELRNIPQFVGFQPVNRLILHPECLHKSVAPARVEKAESSCNHAIVSEEGPLLRAALNNHID